MPNEHDNPNVDNRIPLESGNGEGQINSPRPPEQSGPSSTTGRVSKTVEVDREALDKLITRIESQDKEIQKLNAIADKGRLAHWESANKGAVAKVYYLNSFNGKVITSWSMKQNLVWKDPEGKWKEKQEIELTLEDGETLNLPYVEFVTNTQKVESKLVSTEQKGGKIYLTVQFGDDKKITIDSVFIN